jgi:hypothetical protein
MFRYTPPQVEYVPPQIVVDVSVLSLKVDPSTLTIPEAIEIYIDAYNQQFANVHHQVRKRTYLRRFLTYIAAHHHSLQLADFTLADGQGFLDALVNLQNGTPLSRPIREQPKSTLRTFSRFLYQAGLLCEDIFFALAIDQRAKIIFQTSCSH